MQSVVRYLGSRSGDQHWIMTSAARLLFVTLVACTAANYVQALALPRDSPFPSTVYVDMSAFLDFLNVSITWWLAYLVQSCCPLWRCLQSFLFCTASTPLQTSYRISQGQQSSWSTDSGARSRLLLLGYLWWHERWQIRKCGLPEGGGDAEGDVSGQSIAL